MPAYKLSSVRLRRPLTCDACSKAIVPIAVVTICGHCRHVRHVACSKLPCAKCGSLVRRNGVYRTGKILRYM